MILPDEGRDERPKLQIDLEKPHSPKNNVWTPRELIDSLSKWKQDEPIDVVLIRNQGHPDAILVQGNNSILLTEGRR